MVTTMAERIVTKELGGAEDLTFGVDTVDQTRGSGVQTITRINASHIPLIDAANLIAAGNVEAGLAELITLINTNIANIAANTSAISVSEGLNGSFEVGDSSDPTLPALWQATIFAGGAIAIEETDVIHGTRAVRCTSTGTGGGSLLSGFLPVAQNSEVGLAWYLRSSIATVRNIISIDWYDQNNVLLSSSNLYDETIANPVVWTFFSFTATSPAGAAFLQVRLVGADSSSVSVGFTLFDGVALYEGFEPGVRLFESFASQAQTDLGGVATASVTPNTLASYTPVSIAGYSGGVETHLNDTGADSSAITFTGSPVDAWVQYGGPGSGAANIWNALNNVPLRAKAIIVRGRVVLNTLAILGISTIDVFGRGNGSGAAADNTTLISALRYENIGAGVETSGSAINDVMIPVDANNIVEFRKTQSNIGTSSQVFYLVGWIE